MSFSDLDLSAELLKALSEKGYSQPSPIQAKAIPAVLTGKDVMAAAQTGTGKTASFTLPMLELLANGEKSAKQKAQIKAYKASKGNGVRALVLTPTRELAAQVHDNIRVYSQYLSIKAEVVFGGVKINPQMMRLRGGVDILVATPGRLLDLYSQNAIHFDQLEILVLDEADRMLDMGFIRDIKKILALLPKQRQNLLFSATFSDDIRELAQTVVNNPVGVSVNPANTTAATIEHWLVTSDKKRKQDILHHLIEAEHWQQVLVFSRTKHGANRIARFLETKNISAAAIHGNKSQGARTKALAAFKAGEVRVLVATDIAARGIDIQQLPQVVNFDLPNVAEDYVHRIGRTGRAGSKGQAISLVCADEHKQLEDIEYVIQQHIPRRALAQFPTHNELPASRVIKPLKKKKPKKIKVKKPETSQENPEAGSSTPKKQAQAKPRSVQKQPSNNKQTQQKRSVTGKKNAQQRKGKGNLNANSNNERKPASVQTSDSKKPNPSKKQASKGANNRRRKTNNKPARQSNS
ncbi:DEAD/DEAH box helicase [Endozoicomonas sp. G2_1]|nr:DEAD/DEAH box helicase [Endozoicomonas sp. G2_1]